MLTRLKLRDFRCFRALELELGQPETIFIGANAQGKTSLLEAICVLLRLQSPRVTVLAHAVRHDARGFVVDGYFDERHLQFYYGRERKKLALDGVEQRTARAWLELGRVVYFSNHDIDIARGTAEHRRRFLDFLGAQLEPGYRTHLRNYERALRSRNRLLKTNPGSRREIAAFTRPLVEEGGALVAARARILDRLAPAAANSLAVISGGNEAFALDYAPSAKGGLAEAIAEAESEDLRRGMTTRGPHRDDFKMSLNGSDSAFASEGQQRSIVLALRTGEAACIREVLGAPPVFLVDDVFGELDVARRNALFQLLPPDAQKFITTTHLDWMEKRTADIFRVQDGAVARETF